MHFKAASLEVHTFILKYHWYLQAFNQQHKHALPHLLETYNCSSYGVHTHANHTNNYCMSRIQRHPYFEGFGYICNFPPCKILAYLTLHNDSCMMKTLTSGLNCHSDAFKASWHQVIKVPYTLQLLLPLPAKLLPWFYISLRLTTPRITTEKSEQMHVNEASMKHNTGNKATMQVDSVTSNKFAQQLQMQKLEAGICMGIVGPFKYWYLVCASAHSHFLLLKLQLSIAICLRQMKKKVICYQL